MKRLILGVLAIGQLTGCVAWRPQTVGPRELLASSPQEVIKITTADSIKGFTVYEPRVVGDTLTGHPTETAIYRLAIPVRDVTGVATRYRHIGKSLVAGLAVLGGVLIYGLLQELNGTSP